jgi:hypothetical protein
LSQAVAKARQARRTSSVEASRAQLRHASALLRYSSALCFLRGGWSSKTVSAPCDGEILASCRSTKLLPSCGTPGWGSARGTAFLTSLEAIEAASSLSEPSSELFLALSFCTVMALRIAIAASGPCGQERMRSSGRNPYPAGPPLNPLLCAGWLLHDSRPVHFLMVSGDPTAHRAIAPRRALMLERSTTDHALAGTRLMPPRRAPSLIAGFAYAARGAVAGRRPLTAASDKQLAATIAALLAPLRGHLGAA